jgi:hypothetical protein
LGGNIVTSVIQSLSASSIPGTNEKSAHALFLLSRHALRENGCHRHVFHQRAVIEFLVKEGNSVAVIHERLRGVYGDVCMGVSSQKEGETF